MRRFIIIAALSIPLLAACSSGGNPAPSPLSPAIVQPTSTTNQDAPSLEGVHTMTSENKPQYVPPTVSGDISTPAGVCKGITELNLTDLNTAIAVHLKLTDGLTALTKEQQTQVDTYRLNAFKEACPYMLDQPQIP